MLWRIARRWPGSHGSSKYAALGTNMWTMNGRIGWMVAAGLMSTSLRTRSGSFIA
jgi:hypothetical protein